MKNADSKLKTGEVSKTYKKHKTSEWSQYQKISRQEEKRERKEAEILRPGYPSYTHYGTKDNPFGDKDKIEEAVSKIKSRKKTDKPWCQFVGTNAPHDPYFVPRKYLEMYDINDIKLPDNYYDSMEDRPNIYQRTRQLFTQLTEAEHKEAVRHYLAFCTYEDDLFGKILAALEETGEANNTIVIYLSDHGDYMAEHGLWSKGLPGFKSAYHVPFAVRWPDGIKNPGRIINQFISLADFAPTILELAGIKVERKFTGNSILPFIKDEKIDNWRDTVFTQTNGNELYGIQRSVMTRYWKYVFNGFDFDELYNLAEDPLEVNNLINEPGHAEIVRQLSRKMWKFAKKTGDDCISPYIVVGLAPYGPAEAFR